MAHRKPGGKRGTWFAYAPVDDGRRPSPRRPRPWRDAHSAGLPAELDPDVPVKLMPEYSVELPIWHYDWWQLGLEASSLDELADWQAFFDANFDPFEGWTHARARDDWAADAERLTRRLREAPPDDIELVVDLWPFGGRT